MVDVMLARLREPSSWASIVAALGMIGFAIPDELWTAVSLIGSGVALLLGIVLRERPR
jgi:hypothetical protein